MAEVTVAEVTMADEVCDATAGRVVNDQATLISSGSINQCVPTPSYRVVQVLHFPQYKVLF